MSSNFNNIFLLSFPFQKLHTHFLDGYAFSQEEGAAVTQTDIIRAYDTNLPKPDGI